MLQTYKAILRGNRLEWRGDGPEHIDEEQAVEVYVTILKEAATASEISDQGKRMSAALETLAGINALSDISDPSAWQREQRQDRPLPDRNN